MKLRELSSYIDTAKKKTRFGVDAISIFCETTFFLAGRTLNVLRIRKKVKVLKLHENLLSRGMCPRCGYENKVHETCGSRELPGEVWRFLSTSQNLRLVPLLGGHRTSRNHPCRSKFLRSSLDLHARVRPEKPDPQTILLGGTASCPRSVHSRFECSARRIAWMDFA